jgi:quinol monooxygenase YgiN
LYPAYTHATSDKRQDENFLFRRCGSNAKVARSGGIDTNRIWLYEVYKDEAAFQAHTQAPHFIKFRDTTKDWRREGPQGAGRGASNIWPPDSQWK